jgi:flagellar basal-body rod protein FlgC
MSHQFKVAGVFSAMEVAASGLTAERGRMNVIASNLANARTTKGADGQPYHRLDPVFSSHSVNENSFDPVLRNVSEVSMDGVKPDQSPGQMVYDPGHPDANASGYVEYPNVNVVTEMVNLMTASRAYEAGVTSIESIKSMAKAALKIGT